MADAHRQGRDLLYLNRSHADLAKIPGRPKEGMLVTICMIGEIEMEATLEWNAKWDAWTGRPDLGTVRDNTESWDDHAQGS